MADVLSMSLDDLIKSNQSKGKATNNNANNKKKNNAAAANGNKQNAPRASIKQSTRNNQQNQTQQRAQQAQNTQRQHRQQVVQQARQRNSNNNNNNTNQNNNSNNNKQQNKKQAQGQSGNRQQQQQQGKQQQQLPQQKSKVLIVQKAQPVAVKKPAIITINNKSKPAPTPAPVKPTVDPDEFAKINTKDIRGITIEFHNELADRIQQDPTFLRRLPPAATNAIPFAHPYEGEDPVFGMMSDVPRAPPKSVTLPSAHSIRNAAGRMRSDDSEFAQVPIQTTYSVVPTMHARPTMMAMPMAGIPQEKLMPRPVSLEGPVGIMHRAVPVNAPHRGPLFARYAGM